MSVTGQCRGPLCSGPCCQAKNPLKESTLPDHPGLPNQRYPEGPGSLNLPVPLKDTHTNHSGASRTSYNIQLTNVPQVLWAPHLDRCDWNVKYLSLPYLLLQQTRYMLAPFIFILILSPTNIGINLNHIQNITVFIEANLFQCAAF